jgi:hypothetical protein
MNIAREFQYVIDDLTDNETPQSQKDGQDHSICEMYPRVGDRC